MLMTAAESLKCFWFSEFMWFVDNLDRLLVAERTSISLLGTSPNRVTVDVDVIAFSFTSSDVECDGILMIVVHNFRIWLFNINVAIVWPVRREKIDPINVIMFKLLWCKYMKMIYSRYDIHFLGKFFDLEPIIAMHNALLILNRSHYLTIACCVWNVILANNYSL